MPAAALVLAACSAALAAGENVIIESLELPLIEDVDQGPVSASEATGGSEDHWLGLPIGELEKVTGGLPRPLVSPMLAALWRQLLKGGGSGDGPMPAFRTRELLRSGWVSEAAALLDGAGSQDPALNFLRAKVALARSDGSEACPILRQIPVAEAGRLEKATRVEFVLIAAYCAALTKDQTQTALAAEVVRDAAIDRPVALAVLEGLSEGIAPELPATGGLDLIDARLVSLTRPLRAAGLGDQPVPDVVAMLLADTTRDAESRAEAVEFAVRAHLLPASALRDAYMAIEIAPELKQNPFSQDAEGTLKRAVLFQAAVEERAMLRRSRYLRALLDETAREGFGHQAAALLADAVEELPRVGEIGWFAETAVEILVAAGHTYSAAAWVRRDGELDTMGGRLGLGHWLVLADIAGQPAAGPETAKAELERAVRAGVFPPEVLQRLVTVLDALELNVPISVWDAAGSGLQVNSGELPETGLLSQLQQAARAGDRPRTVLLAVLALAKGGPGGAHQLALGDAIRALKQVGMEREARTLAFEALYPVWPRRAGG